MKIRSITYFFHPQTAVDRPALQQAASFIQKARRIFEDAGYEVQTTRLASTPFITLFSSFDAKVLSQWAAEIELAAAQAGYDFVSIGPALPDTPASYKIIPDILAATRNVFVSGLITSPDQGIHLPSVRACADVIQRASILSGDGFANLRFAALANVSAGAPFFPAAYHIGQRPAFALAMEAADLAVLAVSEARSIDEARQGLIDRLQENARQLTDHARQLVATDGLIFGGIDFSLAPFPEEARSLGTAIERLGVPGVGLHGSLAAAAFLADALDRAEFPRAGFNGLFMPLLEDSILGRRAVEGSLAIKDLLLYAAVCGAGLDTIPLPGDTSVEALAAILLDLAALSSRLSKPLTARLMPIPGKFAGDETGFDFDYFTNSRVLAVSAASLTGLLATGEWLDIQPRKKAVTA